MFWSKKCLFWNKILDQRNFWGNIFILDQKYLGWKKSQVRKFWFENFIWVEKKFWVKKLSWKNVVVKKLFPSKKNVWTNFFLVKKKISEENKIFGEPFSRVVFLVKFFFGVGSRCGPCAVQIRSDVGLLLNAPWCCLLSGITAFSGVGGFWWEWGEGGGGGGNFGSNTIYSIGIEIGLPGNTTGNNKFHAEKFIDDILSQDQWEIEIILMSCLTGSKQHSIYFKNWKTIFILLTLLNTTRRKFAS